MEGLAVKITQATTISPELSENRPHLDMFGITYVKGSPVRKPDLQRCHIRKAYGVVLLGGREDDDLAGIRENH